MAKDYCFGAILAALALCACDTTAAPTPLLHGIPSPTYVDEALPSGGIGLSRAAWEHGHGLPNKESEGGVAIESLANYEESKYRVEFWDNTINGIARFAGSKYALPLAQAQQEAHSMLPADAQFSTSYRELRPDSDLIDTIEIYTSDWLSTRYSHGLDTIFSPWYDCGPGTISIGYLGEGGAWNMRVGACHPTSTPLPLP